MVILTPPPVRRRVVFYTKVIYTSVNAPAAHPLLTRAPVRASLR